MSLLDIENNIKRDDIADWAEASLSDPNTWFDNTCCSWFEYYLCDCWNLSCDDKNNILGDGNELKSKEEWKIIVNLTKKAFAKMYPFARVMLFKTPIRIKRHSLNFEHDWWCYDGKLGCFVFGPTTQQDIPYIELYVDNIKSEARRLKMPFQTLASYVLVHELGHFLMYDKDCCPPLPIPRTHILNEESSAESIALICMSNLFGIVTTGNDASDSSEPAFSGLEKFTKNIYFNKLLKSTDSPDLCEYHLGVWYYIAYKKANGFDNPEDRKNGGAGLQWYDWKNYKRCVYG